MKNSCYLATTAISEIWDREAKLVILGPWCLTPDRNKQFLSGKDYFLLPSPWKPAFKIKEAEDYCCQIYEEVLPMLANSLNSLHRVSYPKRYWQILLGPWLIHFIGIFYDRYKRIEKAFESYPDLYTHVLSLEDIKINSSTTFDFLANQANEDLYNLNLFSFIAHEFFPLNIKKINDFSMSRVRKNNIKLKHSWKGKVFNRFLSSISFNLAGSLLLANVYQLTIRDKVYLSIKAGAKGLRFINFDIAMHSVEDNFSSDLRMAIIVRGTKDKFQEVLYKALPYTIPSCYVEGYNKYQSSVKINGANSIKAIGSAWDWYFNEELKFFAAESLSEKVKFIEFQFGGNGFLLANPTETLSLEKDIFYSWGWNSKNNDKIKPLPSPYLSRLRDRNSQKSNVILFIGTGVLRYQYRFHSALFPEDMPKYFEDKRVFLRALENRVRSNILYRCYPHEYGWDEKRIIKEVKSDIKFLKKGRLIDWAKKARLAVIDHPHTSFLEALTINVPCVFYWDRQVYMFKPEAEEYFNRLRTVGILYDDPVKAACKANDIYDSPLEWWLSRDVQVVRSEFCERYAYASKDWLNIWVKELEKISK